MTSHNLSHDLITIIMEYMIGCKYNVIDDKGIHTKGYKNSKGYLDQTTSGILMEKYRVKIITNMGNYMDYPNCGTTMDNSKLNVIIRMGNYINQDNLRDRFQSRMG